MIEKRIRTDRRTAQAAVQAVDWAMKLAEAHASDGGMWGRLVRSAREATDVLERAAELAESDCQRVYVTFSADQAAALEAVFLSLSEMCESGGRDAVARAHAAEATGDATQRDDRLREAHAFAENLALTGRLLSWLNLSPAEDQAHVQPDGSNVGVIDLEAAYHVAGYASDHFRPCSDSCRECKALRKNISLVAALGRGGARGVAFDADITRALFMACLVFERAQNAGEVGIPDRLPDQRLRRFMEQLRGVADVLDMRLEESCDD